MKKNKFKNQKGVISVFAMLAMLFFLLFIIGAYMTISRKNKSQQEINKELLKLYSTDVNPQDVYNEMIASKDEVRPVYTSEQLAHRNDSDSNFKYFGINGKIYAFQNRNKYEIKANFIVDGNSNLDNNANRYVAQEYMTLLLNGENNTGDNGHTNTTNEWASIVGLLTKPKGLIYSGNHQVSSDFKSWQRNGLVLTGNGPYVWVKDNLPDATSGKTLEIVYKPLETDNKALIGNSTVGIGIKKVNSVNRLVGKINLGDGRTSGIVSNEGTSGIISANKIYHAALTYDGKNLKIYHNGKFLAQNQYMSTEYQTVTTTSYKTVTFTGESTQVGLTTYIGKESDPTSRSGITIKGIIIDTTGNYDFAMSAPTVSSSMYWLDSETVPKRGHSYYKNIADINDKTKVKFNLSIKHKLGSGGFETKDVEMPIVNVGVLPSEEDNKSFSVVSVGSDSLVIKSNIGKIDKWYFSGAEKTPTKSTEIFGNYYYSFDNLTPGTTYNIKGEYSIENELGENNNFADLYIGKDYEDNFGLFKGVIYTVRAYNTVLTEDSIRANFNIDKNIYGITE